MSFTRRNHYNPCFWVAFWNRKYREVASSTSTPKLSPREQIVHVLNVKSNKIYKDKAQNVHFDKNLGIAEITLDMAKEFCKRHLPEKYDDFCAQSSIEQYPVFMDFENILSALESTPGYITLLNVIKRGTIAFVWEKAYLADFVFIQLIRSHAIMNSMIEFNTERGIKKFEYFMMLKQSLSDPKFMFPHIAHIASSLWVLYQLKDDTFPLTDSAILLSPGSIMVALSPNLLLEISTNTLVGEDVWITKEAIESEKLLEFQRRTIGNTFREIVFSDEITLTKWQRSKEFKKRVALIKKTHGYNELISIDRERELKHINSFGNH